MNNKIESLIIDYSKKGIRLWVDKNKLFYSLKNENENENEIIKNLKENKSEIISFLNANDCNEIAYPVSYEQRSLWFLDKMYNTGSTYNLFSVIEIFDNINLEKLSNSILYVLSRHEILRTTYFMQFGSLWQKVLPIDSIESLSSIIPEYIGEIHDEDFQNKLDIIANKEFSLEIGPVINFKILHRIINGLDKYYFVVCIHHIVADFNSLKILQREITEHYFGNQLSQVKSYFDTIKTQSEIHKEAIDLQTTKLQRIPEIPNLGWSKRISRENDYISLSWDISSKAIDKIRKITEDNNVTTFSVIFSLYIISIAKLSQQSEILINLATTLTNTTNKDVVGNFSNLVPFIVNLDLNDTYIDIIKNIFNQIVISKSVRNLPFPLLIEKLGFSNVNLKSPLTPLTFAWHSSSTTSEFQIGKVHTSSRQVGSSGDLMLTARDIDGKIDLKFCANEEIISYDKLNTLKEIFLECINSNFNSRPSINNINLKYEDTKEATLIHNQNNCFFENLRMYSDIQPNKIAVRVSQQDITYYDLFKQVKSISEKLNSLGISVGDRVAVNIPKNIKLIPLILGIIFSGATYVPIDTSLPIDRLKIICYESKVKLVISDNDSLKLQGIQKRTVDFLYRDNLSQTSKIIHDFGETTAYIIYTSGSTGIPKGVPITYKALNIFLKTLQLQLQLKESTRFLSISSISFDASIAEIFLPLYCGSTLILANQEDVRNPEKINYLIEKEKINALQATPTTWKSLIKRYPDKIWDIEAYSMGEALETFLAQKLNRKVNSLWNLYGPTEATVYVSADKFDPLNTIQNSSPFIPIKNTLEYSHLYILDENRKPITALGVIGDLYIVSPQISPGYLNSSNDSFVSLKIYDNKEPVPAYRTGDLAKYSSENFIDIIGRDDSQIKINGYRIEIGEIEALINKFPNVVNSTVISLDKRNLYVALLGNEVNIKNLREYLFNNLPSYMVPIEYYILNEWPTNNSGKIDKIAIKHIIENLKSENMAISEGSDLNPIESKLLDILSDILRFNIYDIHSNIFSMGLDSLHSVSFKMKILKYFSVDLSMDEIYSYPTISSLASLIHLKFKNEETYVTSSFESDLDLPHIDIPEISTKVIKNVLLTGATGYLGSRILRELLNNNKIIIYCLIRAADYSHAKERLLSQLKDINIDNVRIINGSLGIQNFGMNYSEYIKLSEKIDSVIHCAAIVNFALPYSIMRENVIATKQIIEFCSFSKLKFFNFISTYSVLNPELQNILEVPVSDDHKFLNFGYARSKWVCEQLLLKAIAKGIPCKIYRPSRIISEKDHDNLNLKDFYSIVIAGSIISGYAPSQVGADNFVNVSTVARIISEESVDNQYTKTIFNLCSSQWVSWDHIISLIEKVSQKSFLRLPYLDWVKSVNELTKEHSTLYTFKEIYPFLFGMANELRLVFNQHHPFIEVSSKENLDIKFDQNLISSHYKQITKYHSI
ncbi:AMP-binding protein [Acinetobacter pollinis]|uniref:AMP-binding protein n=1 Tax=Acinetobacter pollinis TaxID=2605270 RepID=A0ABU6DYA5_9GAMM|nr:AMP-binding protein [Acinetobacter pollinis]MEB5477843.1 AMP-binding protein [Acinetobacter pollinis]